MTEQEYAKKIREILKFEGIKIGDAEKIAGLHVGYLSRIANGKGRLGLNTAEALAKIVRYPLAAILTEDIIGNYEKKQIRSELAELKKREEELRRRLEE